MNTLFGILFGTIIVISLFYFEDGNPIWIVSWSAILIVVGGAIIATIAGSNFNDLKKIPKLIKIAFSDLEYQNQRIINQIVYLSTKARKDGVLSLESDLENIKEPFLRKLIQYSIDGVEKETYEKLCETELNFLTDRHETYIDVFQRIAGFSPTMGVLGTIIALITTLASSSEDPSILIQRIAFAFITTFWGIFMANFVWIPIADKLRNRHNAEMQVFQMMIDGVYGIVSGEVPSIIKARLAGFFPINNQHKILNERAKFSTLKKENK